MVKGTVYPQNRQAFPLIFHQNSHVVLEQCKYLHLPPTPVQLICSTLWWLTLSAEIHPRNFSDLTHQRFIMASIGLVAFWQSFPPNSYSDPIPLSQSPFCLPCGQEKAGRRTLPVFTSALNMLLQSQLMPEPVSWLWLNWKEGIVSYPFGKEEFLLSCQDFINYFFFLGLHSQHM